MNRERWNETDKQLVETNLHIALLQHTHNLISSI